MKETLSLFSVFRLDFRWSLALHESGPQVTRILSFPVASNRTYSFLSGIF